MDDIAALAEGVGGAAEIDGVPWRDRRCDQGEPAGAMLLRLGRAERGEAVTWRGRISSVSRRSQFQSRSCDALAGFQAIRDIHETEMKLPEAVRRSGDGFPRSASASSAGQADEWPSIGGGIRAPPAIGDPALCEGMGSGRPSTRL